VRQKVFSSVTANGITRFPWAANEPPRADALRGLIEAFGTAITRPTENICSHRTRKAP